MAGELFCCHTWRLEQNRVPPSCGRSFRPTVYGRSHGTRRHGVWAQACCRRRRARGAARRRRRHAPTPPCRRAAAVASCQKPTATATGLGGAAFRSTACCRRRRRAATCGGGGSKPWTQTPCRRVPSPRPWASGRKLRPQLGGAGFCSSRQACSSAEPRFPASAHAFRGPLSLGTTLQHRTCARGEGDPGCPGQSGPPSSKRRPVCVLNE